MHFDWKEYVENLEKFWQTSEKFVFGLKNHNMSLPDMLKCENQSRMHMQYCIQASEVFLKNFDKNGGGGKMLNILCPVHAKMVLARLKESFGTENIWLFDKESFNDSRSMHNGLNLSIQYGTDAHELSFATVYEDELDCLPVLQNAVIKSCVCKGKEQEFYIQLKDALWLAERDRLLVHVKMQQESLRGMDAKITNTDQTVGNLAVSIREYQKSVKQYPNTIAHKSLCQCDEVLDSIAEDMENYVYMRKNAKEMQYNLKQIYESLQNTKEQALGNTLTNARK